MTAPSFEILFTYEFVKRSLPARCRRVLEIGAGTGALAALLVRDGLAVVALDRDADAVTAARERGVDARSARWPEALEERFDAVLFTRSLHHIHPLAESVAAAVACLAPQGRLVVEDFAYEAVDQRTLDWFGGEAHRLRQSGLLPGYSALLEDLLASGGSLATWRRHHDHDLHAVPAMDAALRDALAAVTVEPAPYLFRYLGAAMANAPPRDQLLRALAEQEAKLIAAGAITALGWRLCGTLAG